MIKTLDSTEVLDDLRVGEAGRLAVDTGRYPLAALAAAFVGGRKTHWSKFVPARGVLVQVSTGPPAQLHIEVQAPGRRPRRLIEEVRAPGELAVLGAATVDRVLDAELTALPERGRLPALVVIHPEVIGPETHEQYERLEQIAARHTVAVALLHHAPTEPAATRHWLIDGKPWWPAGGSS